MIRFLFTTCLICSFKITFAQNIYSDKKFSPLNSLRKYAGKYPSQIKLIGNSELTKRLKKLTGSDFKDLASCVVETPIVVKGDVFIASACFPHECPEKNYTIVYDFKQDLLNVKIKNFLNGNSRVILYSEDGMFNKEIDEGY